MKRHAGIEPDRVFVDMHIGRAVDHVETLRCPLMVVQNFTGAWFKRFFDHA